MEDLKNEFCSVQAVKLNPKKMRPHISRVDIPVDYLDKGYYFVKPPFMFRMYQKLCFNGFENKYEQLCDKYNHA